MGTLRLALAGRATDHPDPLHSRVHRIASSDSPMADDALRLFKTDGDG